MSSPKAVDQMLKSLRVHLSSIAEKYQLRQWGWFDFQNHDHPITTDPIEMAYAAFVHLSLEASGNRNGATAVLIGVLAFLREATGRIPSEGEVRELQGILTEQPVRSQKVKIWFDQTFL